MNLFILLTLVFFFLSITGTVSAQTNSTSQNSLPKMFNPTISQYNIYNDSFHNFSITPPDRWQVQSLSNGTNGPLVEFSNQNPSSLATLEVDYAKQEPISQTVFTFSDDQILNGIVSKLFDPTQETILQKNIERFSDGFVIQVVFEPKQTTQNTPINEWFLFWLTDGRQYFLILTSSQNGFNQNAAEFEKAAFTFYVSPQKVPSVPEFGPLATLVFVATLSLSLFVKMRKIR